MSLRNLINDYIIELPPSKDDARTASNGIPGIPGPSTGAQPQQAPASSVNFQPQPSYSGVTVDSSLVPKFAEKIQSAYSKSAMYDTVKKFEQALEDLKEFVPEEGQRFRAALKQLHLAPDDIAGAYRSLVGIIQGEDAHFQEIIEQQRATEIGQREKNAADKNAQIEAKNNEIRTLMSDRDVINSELVSMRTKLDTAKNSFDGAAKQLQTTIEESIRKVGIYIPTTTTK